MQSPLFDQANLEVQAQQRFALQNPQMLRVHLGGDVLAVKGAMVSYQGHIRFDHEKAGSVGKLFKKVFPHITVRRLGPRGENFNHYYTLGRKGSSPASTPIPAGSSKT